MLLQRRRLFRWRMSRLIPLMFLGMICSSELASVNVPQSSSTPSDKKKSPNIGSFNNFKWKAWLLVDTEIDPHELDTESAQLRRITPKSVFIAPQIKLVNCSDGYKSDSLNRCVKNVSVNEDMHHIFLLERLNAKYASKPGETNQSNGPLQLNIPLTSNLENPHSTKNEKHETMETFPMNDPILLPVRSATLPDDERKTQTQKETASTVKKDTTLNEDDMIFFRKNFSADSDASSKTDQKSVMMIPVVEVVKEQNDTYLPTTADYKIPLPDMKAIMNILSTKGVDVSNVTEKDVLMEKQQKNSTQVQPTTLVLLLSSTSLPNLDDPTQNNTTDHTVQSNLTSSNTIAKEASNVSVVSSSTVPSDAHSSTFSPDAPSSTIPTISTIPPKDSTEVAPIVVDEHRDNKTHSEDELKMLENPKLNESPEIGILYDEDEEDVDYTYVTNEPDEDESIEMENEEILKHGEAGITIPTRNMERLQQNQTAANQNKTLDTRDQIMIHFNDTTSADDDDEVDSNVSSDVSIDGDRILETTLLDVNTERLQTTTQVPEIIVKNTKNDSKEELFDQRPNSESKVVFVNEELEAAPTSSESLLYDHPEENPATQISEEKLNAKKKIVQENPKNIESDVSLIDLRQTTMNLDSTEDYVFFPDNVKRPQQDGYVRFPSNEANSIHGPTYKQHPVDDHSFYDSTSTKSSVPVHQKPVYYLTRSSWKPDRPQRDHVPATTNKRRRPELSFWNKMIRDPATYPVDQVPNDEAADDQVQHRLLRTSPSRRRSSYSEISSENMMLAQK